MMLDKDAVQILMKVTTATITTVLLKKGLRNIWLRRTAPLLPNQPRVVGEAFTMRFVPAREDIATPAAWSSPKSTRMAVEAMPEGCIVVADTAGIPDAGIFGDILCARMQQKGVAGLVTDGAVRDRAGIVQAGLPVWCSAVAAPPAIAQLAFVDWQETIGCGGVAIIPGDIIVADDDGAIVIPRALLDHVLEVGFEQEQNESWILAQVKAGAALGGFYPMSADNQARYVADREGGRI
jgi:regulator of RNase E activity RraA